MGKAGRPTKVTKTVAKKLIEASKMELNVTEACALVGISTPTFYAYANTHENFLTEFRFYQKAYLKSRAKANIAKDIAQGNIKTSKWYLENKDPDFNPIQQLQVTVPTFVDDVPKEDDVDGYGNTEN